MTTIILIAGLSAVASVSVSFDIEAKRSSPWPIPAMVAFFVVLTVPTPLWSYERSLGFVTLMATLMIGRRWHYGGERRWLAAGLCVVTTATSLITGARPFVPDNPNIVAGWFLLLPFGWWTLLGVISTQSLGAGVALAMSIFYRGFSVNAKRAATVIAVGLLIVLGFIRWNGFTWNRTDYWREALQFFAARPITGWGSGSYYMSVMIDTPEAKAMNATVDKRTLYSPHAHNAILTIAAENGLVGLASLGLLLAGIVGPVIKSNHPGKWGLLAFCVQQMVDDTWLYPPTAFLLGLALVAVVEWQKTVGVQACTGT